MPTEHTPTNDMGGIHCPDLAYRNVGRVCCGQQSPIGVLGAGAKAAAPTASVPQPTPAPIVVSTPSVKTGDKAPDKLVGGANLTYNGEIMADRIIPVVAEVAGQVVKVAVDAGSKVKTGDLLVKIDSSIPEAQRAQAMAGVEAAQSQLDLATHEAARRPTWKRPDLAWLPLRPPTIGR